MWKDVFPEPQKFFDWINGIKNWNSFEGWVAKVLIVVFLIGGVLWVFRYCFEVLVKIKECWENLGLPRTLSPEKRLEIRRRKQFCQMMGGDIALLNKAENWNDQFFTDLEAEVEAEGRYYVSAVHRLLRRQSQGLRRVPSLIRAIETSAEPFLLLVGEPGSGKSVALRHLAISTVSRT